MTLTAIIATSAIILNAENKTFTAYFIGNSLTRGLSLDKMENFFSQRRMNLEYGSQLAAGTMLNEHLVKTALYTAKPLNINNIQNRKFGSYDEALQKSKFDALVIQPYQWWVETQPHFRFKDKHLLGDRQAIGEFIKYALGNNPSKNIATENFFIYETWPRLDGIKRRGFKSDGSKIENFDDFYEAHYTYDVLWKQPVHTVPSKEFTKLLLEGLNKDFHDLKKPIRVIPVGEILCKLDKMIRNAEMPGIEKYFQRNKEYYLTARAKIKDFFFQSEFNKEYGVMNLYTDMIHLNTQPHNGKEDGTLGAYIAAITVFSVITGESPIGIEPTEYKRIDKKEDAELIKKIQALVWDTIKQNSMTGIK